MRKMLLSTLVLGFAAFGMTSASQAYPVVFATGNTNGKQFNAANDGTFLSATGNVYVGATFNYNGPLNFVIGPPQNNTSAGDLNSAFFSNGSITGYTPFQQGVTGFKLSGPSNADFSTQATFLGSSGSAANFQYGSILSFGLGNQVAGTTLTITHDDGASVYQNGVRVGNTTAGPTGQITETVTLTGSGLVQVLYARENGAPSVLNVAVPEPVSLAILGTGLVGLGLIRRRKQV